MFNLLRVVKVDTNYVHRGHWQHITFVHVSHKYVRNVKSEESSTISSTNATMAKMTNVILPAFIWRFFIYFRTEESSTISSANDGQDEGDETEDDEDLQNLIEESSTDFERKSIRRNVNWQDLKLPDTCTMLTTNQGAKIFIIGTAHFSRFVLKN